MDGDIMKLRVTFHKFSKAPKKFSYTGQEVVLQLRDRTGGTNVFFCLQRPDKMWGAHSNSFKVWLVFFPESKAAGA
jgi:hypothetical protein